MNPELIQLILPGVVGYYIFSEFRKTYAIHRGNWDFVFSLAFFSITSKLLTDSLICFKDTETGLKFLTYAFVSMILGLLTSLSYNILIECKKIEDPSDKFHIFCRNALNKVVMVILKNNKVYVSLLIDHDGFSRGETTGDRVIQITPIKSGKINDKGIVDYQRVYQMDEINSSIEPVTIMVREIESIRKYSLDLEKQFSQKS